MEKKRSYPDSLISESMLSFAEPPFEFKLRRPSRFFASFRMTQPFDPEQFMLAPSQEAFDNLKKDDLLSLGKHLRLEVKKSMRNDLIQRIAMKHMISLKIFDGSVLESLVSSDVEIRKLEIDLELRKIDAEKEKRMQKLKSSD